VFAAGVALYPVTDWAHYNHGYTSRILNGTPLTDEDAYRRSSPVYYAEGLADALMIQHGLVDGNVQIQDSFRLAQMLIEMEKNFDLVVYPVEDHGWDEVPTRRDSYRRMTDWFQTHLLGETVEATMETGGGG
jgi:dipeptidyl aminopeptidase/acylaminoacyl peptidase